MRLVIAAIFVSAVFVDAILIPNGGGIGCSCPVASPCSSPSPSPPACPLPPPPSPCSCKVVAYSSGRTHVPAKSAAIDFSDEQKLITITSEDIRRNPTADSSKIDGEPSDATALSRVSGFSNDSTAEPSTAVDGGLDPSSKCNSQVFKKLIVENIDEESSNESKRAISAAAEQKFGGVIDVICSRGHFSYVYTSSLFCEATKGPMTCVALRQAQ